MEPPIKIFKYKFSAIIIVLKQIIKVISKRFARHKQKKLKEMEMTKIDIWKLHITSS